MKPDKKKKTSTCIGRANNISVMLQILIKPSHCMHISNSCLCQPTVREFKKDFITSLVLPYIDNEYYSNQPNETFINFDWFHTALKCQPETGVLSPFGPNGFKGKGLLLPSLIKLVIKFHYD